MTASKIIQDNQPTTEGPIEGLRPESLSRDPWVHPRETVNALGVAGFVDETMDLALGLTTILEILEDHEISKANSLRMYLDDFHLGCLRRMAIRSSRMLIKSAERSKAWVVKTAEMVH